MDGSQSSLPGDRERWERLTGKQRACLDLLLERKTSKQIARQLGIAKPTVDQRLTAARRVLGAADRDETALAYARLRRLYDRIIYDPVELPPPPALMPSDFADDSPPELMQPHRPVDAAANRSGAGDSFGKIGRHDHPPVVRFGIVAVILASGVVAILGGIGIAHSLTRLIAD